MTGFAPRLMDSGGEILEQWIAAWGYLLSRMLQLTPDVRLFRKTQGISYSQICVLLPYLSPDHIIFVLVQ